MSLRPNSIIQNPAFRILASFAAGAALVAVLGAAVRPVQKQWEYKALSFHGQTALISSLNEAGKDGWEAALVLKASEDASPIIVLKR